MEGYLMEKKLKWSKPLLHRLILSLFCVIWWNLKCKGLEFSGSSQVCKPGTFAFEVRLLVLTPRTCNICERFWYHPRTISIVRQILHHDSHSSPRQDIKNYHVCHKQKDISLNASDCLASMRRKCRWLYRKHEAGAEGFSRTANKWITKRRSHDYPSASKPERRNLTPCQTFHRPQTSKHRQIGSPRCRNKTIRSTAEEEWKGGEGKHE